MKKLLLLLPLLFLLGCKGKKGATGAQGPAGPAGPGRVSVLSGLITSDDQFVYDSRFKQNANIAVYLLMPGGDMVEMPFTGGVGSPAEGITAVASIYDGGMEIFNAQTVATLLGLTLYYHVVFVSASAPPAGPSSLLFDSQLLN